MSVRPSTAGEAPRALVTGHYHSLSPVLFTGAPRVVEQFERLMHDAARLLRTSAKLQLLTVPVRKVTETSEDGHTVGFVELLELLAETARETPLELIKPQNDMRRPWSAPIGSGRPGADQRGKGRRERQEGGQRPPRPGSSNAGAYGTGGTGNVLSGGDRGNAGNGGGMSSSSSPSSSNSSSSSLSSSPSSSGGAAKGGDRPGSGSSKGSRPGSGKKVSFDAVPEPASSSSSSGGAAKKKVVGKGARISGSDAVSSRDQRLLSPLEKAIAHLHDLKMRSLDDDTVDVIDAALECLGDGNELFNPTLLEGGVSGGKSVSSADEETQEWLTSTYMESPRFQAQYARKSLKTVTKSIMASMWMAKATKVVPGGALDDIPTPPGLRLASREALRLQSVLKKVDAWDFDVFQVAELTGRPLEVVGYALFRSSGLMEKLDIADGVVIQFLRECERRYFDNPYHNSTHAADVLQTLCYFIRKGELSSHLTALEILGTMVAAIAHDLEHDGFNNNYQVDAISDAAIAYNNKSVLENQSATVLFRFMRDVPETNIFESLSNDQLREVRAVVIDAILSTDMSAHFQLLGQLKSKIAASGNHDASRDDIMLYIKLTLKCADISNPAKHRAQYLRWVDCVMEEFFNQGDREKAEGLKVSPFMDRDTTSVSKCQIGFIDFIVRPLYQACASFLECMEEPINCIDDNHGYFKRIHDKENPPAPDA